MQEALLQISTEECELMNNKDLEKEVILEEELTMNHQHKINIKRLMKLVKSHARGYISDKVFKDQLTHIQDEEVVRIVEALRRGPDEFGAYLVRKRDGSIDYPFRFVIDPDNYELAFGRSPKNLSVSGYYSLEVNREILPLLCRVFIVEEKQPNRFSGVSYYKVHKVEYFTITEGKVQIIKTDINKLRGV